MTSAKKITSVGLLPIAEEPWVKLGDDSDLSNWSRDDEIALNQSNRQTRKYEFFVQTFDFLTDNRVRGDYYEFGCHRCRTFRMALTEARRHNLDSMKFWAFDSFEGLPDSSGHSVEIWQRGALTTIGRRFHGHGERAWALRRQGDAGQRLLLRQPHQGAADALPGQGSKDRARATIDCDLYELAVPVFNFIEPLLQEGSVIYIDDLFAGYKGNPTKGVARAFREFRQRSRFKFVRHLDIGWWGRSYIAYIDADGSSQKAGL